MAGVEEVLSTPAIAPKTQAEVEVKVEPSNICLKITPKCLSPTTAINEVGKS